MDREQNEFTSRYGLSPREKEVFALLTEQVVHFKDIAARLHLSPSTVSNHLKSIFEKTKTNSKTELLALFLKQVVNKLDNCKHLVRKPRILVVDDDKDIGQLLAQDLTDRGMIVYAFSEPQGALDAIASFKLDAVVSDIRMPGMTGIDLLHQIRKTHHYSPAIVFMSGYTGDQKIEQIMHQGAVALVSKPIDSNHLFKVIMEQLIEDAQERDSYFETSERISTVIDEKLTLEIGSIGYGGVFIPASKAGEQLSVGKLLSFTFSLDTDEPIHALGEVAWRRDKAHEGLPAGMGVKFVKISDSDRRKIQDYARMKHILSYIPLGPFEHSASRKAR